MSECLIYLPGLGIEPRTIPQVAGGNRDHSRGQSGEEKDEDQFKEGEPPSPSC